MLAHPIAYIFDNLRTHARERGKSFQLTIEEFTAFCAVTHYHELKGQDPTALTIDRIRPEQGYRKGNFKAAGWRKWVVGYFHGDKTRKSLNQKAERSDTK